MSNHTVIDCATNGNSSGSINITTTATTITTNSMSINSHKNETKTKYTTLPEKNLPLPEKQSKSNSASNKHHREFSNVQQSHDKQRQHNHKDTRKFLYLKPQTYPHNEQNLDSSSTSNKSDKIDDEQFLVYSDNHIISGHLNSLITHLVPTNDYYPDRQYIISFLLCTRLFLRPHELLAHISQTWENQQNNYTQTNDVVDEANFRHLSVTTSVSPQLQHKHSTTSNDVDMQQRSVTQKSAQNCIRLLSDWIETFPYDFRDERLMQQVRIIARKCVYIDNALGKQVSRILQSLVQRLTSLEKYEEFLQSLLINDLSTSQHQHYNTSAAASFSASNITQQHNSLNKSAITALNSGDGNKSGHNILSPVANITSNQTDIYDVYGIMSLCPSCAQLAHQLTSIELERASNIGPEEFVQAFAKEYHQQTITNTTASTNTNGIVMPPNSLNDIKKTRNLESYVEWFNRLSYLTASEIVKYPKKKQRVRIIEYWIETARECFNIGNFNSLMAIIAGLNLAPISRLKKTWSKVQLAKFSVLEHQMDPTSNFNSYRSTLKAAMWRSEGATEERERIIIPFFSLFVKDLYFLNESCSNRLPNNHINFEKCTQLAKQVMEFDEWKKVPCPFEKLPNVIQYLQTHPVLNENTLSMASFECEPPENTEEKGRYKTVKAETKQQLLQQLQQEQQTQHQQ